MKSVLETIKPTTTEATTALTQAGTWFTTPEYLVGVRRPRAPWDLKAHIQAFPDDTVLVDLVRWHVIGRVAPLVMAQGGPAPIPGRISAQHAAADSMFVRLKALLPSLKPTTEQGKAGLARALAEVSRFHGPLLRQRLGKLSLSELEASLDANNDDSDVLAVYTQKARQAIGWVINPATLKVRLEKIKPTTAEARLQAPRARDEVSAAIDQATALEAQNARSEELRRQAQAPLAELETRLKASPDYTTALDQFQVKASQEIIAKLKSDPSAAERLLEAYTEVLKEVQANGGPTVHQRIDMSLKSQVESVRHAIGEAKVRASRIGRPADPLNVEAWVNGPPLTDADLKGKVVLLEYWRNGAPPAIAVVPFSQLRTWSKKCADKGLAIISLTSYSQLVHGMTGPTRQRAMEMEQTMLADLARDNALAHRVGILKDDPKVAPLGPAAFEHLVVSDREGKVRLISTDQREVVIAVDDLVETVLGPAGPGAE